MGNITQLAMGDTLSYDDSDQLQAQLTGSTTTASYDYDDRGNRTSKTAGTQTTDYTWDAENRLLSVDDGTTTNSYTYDGDGVRASTTDGTTVEIFVWDKAHSEEQLLADGKNFYVYGPNGIAVEQINKTTSATTYLHFDRTGSVRLTTDSAGALVGTAEYGLYGEPLAVSTTGTPFGFAGQYEDTTGLIYMRARYYDPATAQFLSMDQLYQSTGDRYSYAAGDPLRFIDSTGQYWGESYVNSYTSAFSSGYQAISGFVSDHAVGIAVFAATAVLTVAALAVCPFTAGAGCVAAVGLIGFAGGALGYSLTADCPTIGGVLTAGLIGGVTNVIPGSFITKPLAALFKPLASGLTGAGKNLLAGAFSKFAKKELDETVDLFRAVDPGEFDSIMSTGKFLPHPGALESKQFAVSLDETLDFANHRINLTKSAIVKVTVNKSVLTHIDFSLDIDTLFFRQGVYTVQPGTQSKIFHEGMVGLEHAY